MVARDTRRGQIHIIANGDVACNVSTVSVPVPARHPQGQTGVSALAMERAAPVSNQGDQQVAPTPKKQ